MTTTFWTYAIVNDDTEDDALLYTTADTLHRSADAAKAAAEKAVAVPALAWARTPADAGYEAETEDGDRLRVFALTVVG